MYPVDSFFPELEEFAHKNLLADFDTPWQPLKNLGPSIQKLLGEKSSSARRVETLPQISFIPRDELTRFPDPGFIVREWVELKETVWIEPAQVLIGAGTILEPTAIVKGPAVIGARCEVRQGAYVRGNVVTGDRCVIGHATEIKNTILMNHSECGHFNYLGDSIVGSYVNLGAGSRLANLQFRSPEDKRQERFPVLRMDAASGDTDTGLEKFGAILGDYVELGCNAVVCPAVLMGYESWVYPNFTVPKGYYEPRTHLAPTNRKIKSGGQ
jgi:NDP-sugar pyrophosphorylase family protein